MSGVQRNLSILTFIVHSYYMRKLLFLSAIVCFSVTAKAQSEDDAIKAAVNLFFQGMKNADAAMIESSFADSAVLQTIDTRTGKPIVKTENIKAVAQSISRVKPGELDEQIVFETIKYEGDLASVWTPYKFYARGKFIHCGTNSFQLVKQNGVWKIQYIIDTRRKEGCGV
jgi:ketosteroid isomerase-like protein